ncbi:MAG TPA: hypothetical protein VHO50_07100 [Bacteroidales bacterium]|nr:hypothetical protein [Bacteroidales bacterium]
MAIKSKTPQSSIDNYTRRIISDAKQTLINTLIYTGEECVKYARLRGNYQDQTGNLRSSIGYAVIDYGQLIKISGFEQVLKGAEGSKEGKELLDHLLSKYKNGIVLIVVAGMNYAAAVEAKDYDVITGSEFKAHELIPKMLKQIGFLVK